jgi:hypothetical protein
MFLATHIWSILITRSNYSNNLLSTSTTKSGVILVVLILETLVLWHTDPLLGSDREINSYTTAVPG